MKIKADFVTNSSSTNFILASKEPLKDVEMCITVDMSKFVEDTIENLEQLERYAHENDMDEDDPDIIDMRAAIKEGKKIYLLSVSDDDLSGVEAYLCRNGLDDVVFPQGVDVIQGDGGY